MFGLELVGMMLSTTFNVVAAAPWDLAGAVYSGKSSLDLTAQDANPNGVSFSSDGTNMYTTGFNHIVYQYTLSTPWDVSTAAYASKSFNFTSQLTHGIGICFNSAGTKMYLTGTGPATTIYQYTLSTAWDVSTASYASKSFNFSAQGTFALSPFLNSAGTKLFLGFEGAGTTVLYQYILSTPEDISTAVYDSGTYDVSSQSANPRGFAFKEDGTKAYIGSFGKTVYEYSLSIPWNISTSSYTSKSFSVASQTATALDDLQFSTDGTKMYATDGSDGKTYQYTLSTPWDVTTASYASKQFGSSGMKCSPISHDGTKIYFCNGSAKTVSQYTMSTPWDISTATSDSKTLNVSAQISSFNGQDRLSDDGNHFYAYNNGGTIYEYNLSTPYDISTATYSGKSFATTTQDSDVRGLGFMIGGTEFITAGNNTGKLYQYPLSVANDISTASFFNGSYDTAANGAGGFVAPFLKPDGLKMFVLDGYDCKVLQYVLGSANSLSSVTYQKNFDFTAQVPAVNQAYGIFVKPDGSAMYILGQPGFSRVYQYTLGSPVISTSGFTNIALSSYTGNFFSVSGLTTPTSTFISPDGTKLFVSDDGSKNIYRYELSTPYNVATASYSGNIFATTSPNIFPWTLFFSADGTKMYASGQTTHIMYQYTLSVAYDLSTASYSGKSFDFGTQETGVTAIFFTGDGTIVYMIGSSNNIVYQYTLSVGYDISTMSYASKSFNPTAQDNGVEGLAFSPDGATMIIIGQNSGGSFHQYTLITPYDVSTAIYTSRVFVNTEDAGGQRGGYITTDGLNIYTVGGSSKKIFQYKVASGAYYLSDISYTGKTLDLTPIASSNAFGIKFKDDGTALYVDGYNTGIYQYTVPTPYDISTAYYSGKSKSISAQTNSSPEIFFKPDGLTLYAQGGGETKVFQYTLSVAWDISTASYASLFFNTGSQDNNPNGMFFKSDGTTMYILGQQFSKIFQYTLSTPWDVSTASYASKFVSVSGVDSTVGGMFISPDGVYLYYFGRNNNDFIQYIMTTPWDISTAVYTDMTLNTTFDEPNGWGLTLSADGTKIYHSSASATSIIYEYSLIHPTTFDLSLASYNIQGFDPTFNSSSTLGIAFSTDGKKMYTTDDGANKTVYQYTLPNPYNVNNAYYSGKSFSLGSQDNTPVDISFSPSGKKMYMTGRGNGKIYQYSLSTAWDVSTASYASKSITLGANVPSVYGHTFSLDGTHIYFATDSGSKIVQYNLTTAFDLSTGTYSGLSFVVSAQDSSPLDVAFSIDGLTMYVIGNTTSKIYQYTLTVPWAVSTASYTGKYVSVYSEGTYAFSITLSPDNSILYAIPDSNNPGIFAYKMTTPPSWDISSTTYTGKSFDVTGQVSGSPIGGVFSTDGMTMFVGNFTLPATIYQYSLAVPFDVSTASYASKSFSVTSQLTDLRGFAFKPDGKTMFVQGHTPTAAIYQYTLSTAWDISTASYASKTKTLSSQDSFPTGLAFKANGDNFYVVGNQNGIIYEYTMSTQWDVSTASYASKSFNPSLGNNGEIALRPDGKKIYLTDSTGSHPIKQYSLATPYDISTASYDGLFFNNAQDSAPFGIFVTPDGLNMFITGAAHVKVYQYTLGTFVPTPLLFVAVDGGQGPSTSGATSPDGATWTARTLPSSDQWQDIAYGNGVFVAVSDTGGTSTAVATSYDGITWALRAMPTGGYWRGICWNGKVFAVVEAVSGICATSPDGIKWTQHSMPSSSRWGAIAYNGSVFCTITSRGNTGTNAATSPDGITWTARTLSSNHYWSDIAWNGTVFCVVGGQPTAINVAMTSPDGTTWTDRTMPATDRWVGIAWNGTVFCAIAGGTGSSNVAATSPDGITWTAQTLPTSTFWEDIIWNGTVFCAIAGGNGGTTNIAATSPDGITWTQHTLPSTTGWNRLGTTHLQFGTY